MKLSHKLFFATIMLFSFCLRYPDSYLEQGSDSFGNHLVSQALINTGNDQRIINLFSFFGLFPGSNNTGGSFLLSAFSIVTDLTVHQSIFILPILLSIIGSFSMFLFARETTRNVTICLFAVLLFSTARYYLSFTEFTYSYRMVYMSLLPAFLFLFIKLFKINFSFDFGFWFLILFLSFALLSIHRMMYLNGLLVVSLIFYYIINYFSTRFKFTNKFLKPIIIYSLLIILYVSSVSGYFFYSGSSEYSLERGKKFFDSDSLHFTIINLGLLYAMQFGFLLPFAALGFVTIIFRKSPIHNYLVFVTLSYSMIWTDLTYGSFAYLPVIVVLVSLGLESYHLFLSKRINKNTAYSILIVIILFLQASPEFFTVKESEYDYINEGVTYSRDLEYIKALDAGLYIKTTSYSDKPIISAVVSGSRISAFSDSPAPVATTNPNAEFFEYKQIELIEFLSGDLNFLFEVADDNLQRSIRYDVFLSGQEWDAEYTRINMNYIFRGNDTYILALYSETNLIKTDNDEWVESPFIISAIESNYKSYDNGFHNLYNLDHTN